MPFFLDESTSYSDEVTDEFTRSEQSLVKN